jgi:phenylpropionate dioxygenase-like ring-hydroxylating dioxygenase large terminal subunit
MDLTRSRPVVELLLEHAEARRPWRATAAEVPAARYTDTAHLRTERDVLFRRYPQVAALSPDLPSDGSVLTRDTFDFPVVLTRDDDGETHAFANVCAHRGAQVVPDGRDCKRRLTCPYHAWSYDLRGRLVAVPDQESFPGLDLTTSGLRRLPIREEHGVVWVLPDLAADPTTDVDPGLGPIGDDLDGFDIGGHRHWRSYRFELDLNWKLVIDTFLEPYHFASLHRATVGPLFIANLCHAERFGHHVREVLPRKSLLSLRNEPVATWDIVPHSALVYVLFPNTVFVMQIDHVETWRVTPHPTDPGRSICDLDFYVPDEPATESSERHWEKNWRLTIDTVIAEDFAAMAGVQRGLASGAIDAIRIGANEPALGLFHAALHDRLGGPMSGADQRASTT